MLDQLRALLRQPEVVVGTWRAAREADAGLGEDTVRDTLARFEPVWGELFPAEQERLRPGSGNLNSCDKCIFCLRAA